MCSCSFFTFFYFTCLRVIWNVEVISKSIGFKKPRLTKLIEEKKTNRERTLWLCLQMSVGQMRILKHFMSLSSDIIALRLAYRLLHCSIAHKYIAVKWPPFESICKRFIHNRLTTCKWKETLIDMLPQIRWYFTIGTLFSVTLVCCRHHRRRFYGTTLPIRGHLLCTNIFCVCVWH